RSRTRRYRLPPGPRVPGSGQAAGSTSESWRCSFINQGLVTRAQLRFPDPIIHHTDELVANDAFGIDQEGLRRAVHAQIQPKAPVSITDIELIGVVEFLQPLPRILGVVLVVHPVDDNALLRQTVEHRVL